MYRQGTYELIICVIVQWSEVKQSKTKQDKGKREAGHTEWTREEKMNNRYSEESIMEL